MKILKSNSLNLGQSSAAVPISSFSNSVTCSLFENAHIGMLKAWKLYAVVLICIKIFHIESAVTRFTFTNDRGIFFQIYDAEVWSVGTLLRLLSR